MQNMQNSAVRAYHGVRDRCTSVLTESRVLEGVLTPAEFVEAGDQLVFKCPTWSWAAGDPSKAKDYLPKEKQYLITKNVPCMQRVAGLAKEYVKETAVENSDTSGDDGWLLTYETSKAEADEEMETIDDIVPPTCVAGRAAEDSDEYADMEDFEDDNLITDDVAAISNHKSRISTNVNNVLATRTYDISISYDKYYQVPRVWLFGYDENSQPLSQKQVFQDIMQDYANRTVTMESHPHAPGGILTASIHPCKHADCMKNIVGHLAQGGKQARTDQYLFIFLKFIQSIIPTVNYDFTFGIEVK
eukprot:GSMAST32.ASY1.ANO1.261.1 assembled CDS